MLWGSFRVVLSCLVMSGSLPTNCSPPGSSLQGIFQARILEWVAISSPRRSSWPRDQTHVSCISCIWQADSLLLAPPGKLGSPKSRSWDRGFNARGLSERWFLVVRELRQRRAISSSLFLGATGRLCSTCFMVAHGVQSCVGKEEHVLHSHQSSLKGYSWGTLLMHSTHWLRRLQQLEKALVKNHRYRQKLSYQRARDGDRDSSSVYYVFWYRFVTGRKHAWWRKWAFLPWAFLLLSLNSSQDIGLMTYTLVFCEFGWCESRETAPLGEFMARIEFCRET